MKIGQKIFLCFSFQAIIILASLYSLYQNVKASRVSSQWVEHTHYVIAEARHLMKLVVDLETGLRGYVITEKEEFLEPLEGAKKSWENIIENLKITVSDNPPQVATLSLLDQKVQSWHENVANPILEAIRSKKSHVAREIISQKQGKNAVDNIRKIVENFISVEKKLLDKRQKKSHQVAEDFLFFIAIFGIVAIFSGFVATFLLSRNLNSGISFLKKNTEKISQGEYRLEILKRNDELDSLSEAIDVMAQNIKHSKELESVIEAKNQFLANMSHEIRTPLNGIIGYASILADEELPEEHKAHLKIIQDSSESLSQILNDILNFSKIDARKMNLRPVKTSLPEIVDSVCQLFALSAQKKGLKFEKIWKGDVPKQIFVDALRVKQILGNLLSNAVKFTAEGAITVYCEVEKINDKIINVHISVKDTGIGIEKKQLSAVFSPFEQIQKGRTKEYEGTGLGLAISKELSELMGGSLDLHSNPGQGSTFFFVFAAEPFYEAKVTDNNETISIKDRKSELKILIAEDNSINKDLLVSMLKILGQLDVHTVENGKRAVEAVQSHRFDLVLMDVQMPVLDGLQASRQIQNIDPTLKIIAVSANSYPEDKELAKSHGMVDYLVKPFKKSELSAILQKHFPEKNMAKKLSA